MGKEASFQNKTLGLCPNLHFKFECIPLLYFLSKVQLNSKLTQMMVNMFVSEFAYLLRCHFTEKRMRKILKST